MDGELKKPLSEEELFKKRGAGIRRPEDIRMAHEGEMTDEQFIFLKAVEKYQKTHNIRFLRHTDYLMIMRALGYRKVVISEPTPIVPEEPVEELSEDRELTVFK